MHAFCLLAFALALTHAGGQGAARANLHKEAVPPYLESLARRGHLSGTVLVAQGSEILLERSYGRSDYQTAEPVTPQTLFAVASITKPLTGIVVRRLAADGRLDLDDPIAKWLPEFPNGSRITVAQLLSHRSGLPHRVTAPEDEQRLQTAESITRLASKATLAFEPGAQRLYSSAGYSVLAFVIERATGRSYAQVVQELVLAPASATSAIDATDAAVLSKARAAGHFWTPDGPLRAPAKHLSYLVGAGSLWATPRDLFKVVRRIVSGGYGHAASGAQSPNGAIRWTGWSNGSIALVDYNPGTDVTIIFTGNLLTGASDWIVRDVPRLLSGDAVPEPIAPKPQVVALSSERRKTLEGIYNFVGNEQRLSFLSPSVALLGGEYLLLATGDAKLFAPLNYSEYTVLTDDHGAVTALQTVGDPNIRMSRVVK